MSFAEFDATAPSCPLPTWHPACAHVPALHEIAAPRKMRSTLELLDDYGLVDAQDWLSAPGGFR